MNNGFNSLEVGWGFAGRAALMARMPLAEASAATPTANTADKTAADKKDAADSNAKALHVSWKDWLSVYSWQNATSAGSILLLTLLLGFLLRRIFRGVLNKHQLMRPLTWGTLAAAIYFSLIALHPLVMTDPYDVVALAVHKTFMAIVLLVGVRLLDRLLIVPLLTRGGKATMSRFIHQLVLFFVMFFMVAWYIHWAFDVDISSLLTGTAVISIVLGLALQETLGNFFSGLVLQASVPFQAGDWIQIGEMEGRVVEMTWRAVTILTNAGNYVLIPNGMVSKEKIVNFHTPTPATSYSVTVGLDYDTPPHVASKVLIQAALETPGVLKDPAPTAMVVSFEASSVGYRLGFWIDEPQMHGVVENTIRANMWYRLKQAGIHVPYNIMTVEMTDTQKKATFQEVHGKAARLDAIRKNSLFSGVDESLQEMIASKTTDFHLAAGQAFFHQDDPADSMFILLEGTAELRIRTEDGREITAREMHAGDSFAEISAFTGHPRSGTISAKTDVRAMEITRQHLQDLFSQQPQLMANMSERVAKLQQERAAALEAMGAAQPDQETHTHSQNVLERMRSFFSLRHR